MVPEHVLCCSQVRFVITYCSARQASEHVVIVQNAKAYAQ